MKTCTKCFVLKQEGDFFVRDKSIGRLHAQCKLCYKDHRKSYSAYHYKKYGDQYRERAKKRRAVIKKDLQVKMSAYLADKSCVICGESDIRVLDFDHIEPSTKAIGISKAITNGMAWEIILEEINKCRILCANCHRKHTAIQSNWYRKVLNE